MKKLPINVAISACIAMVLLLGLMTNHLVAQTQQSSAHPHLKASALHEHAHKYAHTKVSPCEQEAKAEAADRKSVV